MENRDDVDRDCGSDVGNSAVTRVSVHSRQCKSSFVCLLKMYEKCKWVISTGDFHNLDKY